MKFDLLPVLTFVALICSTVIGVAGVFKDYRNRQTKQLTTLGSSLLVITILALILGAVTTFMDANQRTSDFEKLIKKTNLLLINMQRSLSPFRNIDANFEVDLTGKSPALQNAYEEVVRQKGMHCSYSEPDIFWGTKNDQMPAAVRRLVPDLSVEISFIRHKSGPWSLEEKRGRICFGTNDSDCPDMVVYSEPRKEPTGPTARWLLCNKQLVIDGSQTGVTIGNGRILSIKDLIGAQVVVEPKQSYKGIMGAEPGLQSITLQIPGYEPLFIYSSSWRKVDLGAFSIYTHEITQKELHACCLRALDADEEGKSVK